MAITNHERVGKALDLLRTGLKPYIERELKAVYKDRWLFAAKASLADERDVQAIDAEEQWDVHVLLVVMWDNWNDVFKKTLGFSERSIVSELRETRNKWAHQRTFSYDDVYRALDSIQRLLAAVSAGEAQEVDRLKHEVLRLRFDEQARSQRRKVSTKPTEGQPAGGLKPWREVITPHPDVASGRYQQAEFAADLAQVHRGEGTSEYRDPKDFFHRTFLTEGLRRLLSGALLRMVGTGGDPVVDLQTNFGGGKTHSMLALYHLFSGTGPSDMAGIDGILEEIGAAEIPKAKRAVIVGTDLSPAQAHVKPDGTSVNTLWGEIAWQLAGANGYAIVGEADQHRVSPGSNALHEVFKLAGPSLILIDEWVAFVRQLYTVSDLPGGSFDANLTFAQSLTEAAKRTKNVLIVASLPASDIEIGGEGGQEALARLKNIFHRVEYPWRPASAEEGFEIVRRRLFQPLVDKDKFIERDNVINAFSRTYQEQPQEFPSTAREADYERRMENAYPIHPELFDRLFEDWSSLDKFQRTRGVLRLMAAVIHELWERNDGSLLILPATIPIDAESVRFELTRYMEDPWIPVIEKDVDGPNSLPLAIDRDNPNLGRYSAARRTARAIYMGSAPTVQTAHPGIDERSIKLGCVQPGESVATFGDALRRLTDQATHLYVDGARYWFSTQQSVTRLAQDRAAQQDLDNHVWPELERRLREERARGDFAAVHVVPQNTADVPDDQEARLVILGPKYPHARQDAGSEGRRFAEDILNNRGSSPRLFRNMLIFLAPDRTRLSELAEALRRYLAWDSICREREALNLDAFQSGQAETKCAQGDETVKNRIQETFAWLLVPAQPDPQRAVEWQEVRAQGPDPLAVRSSKKLKADEYFITQFSGTRLRMELDKYLWADVDQVSIKKVWEYFCSYLYLPRLRDSQVLKEAVQDGISQITWQDNFAYAQGRDEEKHKYLGLSAGQAVGVLLDSQSVIVKPEVANKQLEEETIPGPGAEPPPAPSAEPEPKKLRRFYGTKKLDPIRIVRDVDQIADEVLQHLNSLKDAEVAVTLEIQAKIPEGASDDVVRIVTENCGTLKFDSHGFEKE